MEQADAQPEIDAAKGGVALDGDTDFEILTRELGSVPTRVIIVEELRNCGVISKKQAKKRIRQILDEADLPLSQD